MREFTDSCTTQNMDSVGASTKWFRLVPDFSTRSAAKQFIVCAAWSNKKQGDTHDSARSHTPTDVFHSHASHAPLGCNASFRHLDGGFRSTDLQRRALPCRPSHPCTPSRRRSAVQQSDPTMR